jgi:hypothetical protein
MKTITLSDQFLDVISELNNNKIPYNLDTYSHTSLIDIKYNGLRALIYSEEVYSKNKRIFAHHSKLFNKMGDSIIQLPLPENELQMKYLFDCFKKISSKQFYDSKEEREVIDGYPSGRDLKKMHE